MYTDLLEQRSLVASSIEEHKDSLVMPYTVKEVLYRLVFYTERVPDVGEAMVYVSGLGFMETCLSRATKAVDTEIQICIEGRYRNEAHIQNFVTLTEQVMSICSGLAAWTDNRMSIDEHGMPYQFHIIREQKVYQAIWDAVYRVQRKRQLIIEP